MSVFTEDSLRELRVSMDTNFYPPQMIIPDRDKWWFFAWLNKDSVDFGSRMIVNSYELGLRPYFRNIVLDNIFGMKIHWFRGSKNEF